MTSETDPVPSPEPDNVRTNDCLLAYREYWNGRRWLIGVYVDLTGSAEVDNFIEPTQGGGNAQQEMDR